MIEETGFLTAEEVQAVQHLHKRAPYAITGIRHSMFSVARHYGGMDYNGCSYIYDPTTDECIRSDVLKLVMKRRKAKSAKQAKPAVQPDLLAEQESQSPEAAPLQSGG